MKSGNVNRLETSDPYRDYYRGTRWRCCLRHCVTSRKVAGSIVSKSGIINFQEPNGPVMGLYNYCFIFVHFKVSDIQTPHRKGVYNFNPHNV